MWIRVLANRGRYGIQLHRLLGLDEVTGHELVYGELLIGDRGGRRKSPRARKAANILKIQVR